MLNRNIDFSSASVMLATHSSLCLASFQYECEAAVYPKAIQFYSCLTVFYSPHAKSAEVIPFSPENRDVT